MASLNTALTPPIRDAFGAPPVVRVQFIGDPVFIKDDIIFFPGYGVYQVKDLISDSALHRTYDLYYFGPYGGAPSTTPAGTVAVTEAEGVTHSELSYASVIALNFKGRDYRTLTLTGDITFNAQRHEPAKSIVVRIRNSSGVTARNMTFPPSWIFPGIPGRPSSIAPSRTGILSITCFGTSDADVIAVWIPQS